MKIKSLPFRAIYYFRQGWALYFAFILSGVNTLTVTYYLAIEKIPMLSNIFPSFLYYVLFAVFAGIPLLVLIGYVHFKKSPAHGSEQDVFMESYRYNFKLPPGYWREALIPTIIELLELDLKMINKESITAKEKKDFEEIQKKLQILRDGGYLGKPKIPWQ